MAESMLCVSEIDWSEVITSGESHVKLLVSKGIPVYIKTRRDLHLVYRNYRHRPTWMAISKDMKFTLIEGSATRGPMCETWIREFAWVRTHKVHDDLLFLLLDNSSLVEISLSGSSFGKTFSGHGFLVPQPYRVVGHRIRDRSEIREYEDIRSPSLERVELCDAFLINKRRWESPSFKGNLTYWDELEECKESIEIGESDLYVTFNDIGALKRGAQQGKELRPYPYEHKEKMPGIYWMFQAAYAQNQLAILSPDAVAKWLRQKAKDGIYRYKSIRTAQKFVWLELDRGKGAKGGNDRGEFSLEDLDDWTVRENYEFPFVSKGLSLILAIADWWVRVIRQKPGETKLHLAKKLEDNKFRGGEIGDLVYLISGLQITEEDNSAFEKHLKENGKVVRRIIDRNS